MNENEDTTTKKLTLEEIQEVYQRLGIRVLETGSGKSFEDYAWQYGFRKQRPHAHPTLDADTHILGV